MGATSVPWPRRLPSGSHLHLYQLLGCLCMVHDARSIALRLPKDGGESVRLTCGPAGQAMGDS